MDEDMLAIAVFLLYCEKLLSIVVSFYYFVEH